MHEQVRLQWSFPPANPSSSSAWVGLFKAKGGLWRFPAKRLRWKASNGCMRVIDVCWTLSRCAKLAASNSFSPERRRLPSTSSLHHVLQMITRDCATGEIGFTPNELRNVPDGEYTCALLSGELPVATSSSFSLVASHISNTSPLAGIWAQQEDALHAIQEPPAILLHSCLCRHAALALRSLSFVQGWRVAVTTSLSSLQRGAHEGGSPLTLAPAAP